MSDQPDDAVAIPLAEERAVVEKQVVENVGATVSTHTEEHQVPVQHTLRRENVEVERVASGIVVDEPPQTRTEDGVLIVPVVEEVLVKRYRIVEEVHVRSRAETVEVSDTVTLRRQTVDVDEDPDSSAG